MQSYHVKPIGKIKVKEDGMFVVLEPKYIAALQSLNGFSHINVIWWFSDFDKEDMRETLEVQQPYKQAPAVMGVFATRSPVRPNPIALTAVQIIDIDFSNGIIHIAYIDANDETPVIDIKPYTPSFDRVEKSGSTKMGVSHWPQSIEESGHYNWDKRI